MKLSVSWLREYVDTDLSVEELADVITLLGYEVEEISQPLGEVSGVVAMRVEEKTPVEGSDKLNLVKAFDGTDYHMIICGASNYKEGDVVPGCKVGATLPGGFNIGKRKMLGVTSNGMLASVKELGIGDDADGIWVLGDYAPPLGTSIVEWLGLDDWVLDLDITPNSGHGASIWGIAREVAAKTGAKLLLDTSSWSAPSGLSEPDVEVSINPNSDCRAFDGRLIEGVSVIESHPKIQARLRLAGFRPINAVVDATNYAMLETGHPTHAFDVNTLVDSKLEIRNAQADEKLKTLDGTDRVLVEDDVVLADAEGSVALAGVMGGERTEVSKHTTNIYLETAAWDPRRVLRSARRHQLFSEARSRFERTVPTETVPIGAARTAQLITEWAGGSVTAYDFFEPKADKPAKITLNPDYIRSILGIEVSDEEQKNILESIDCEIEGNIVTPPAWRPDLTIEADLAEEIARFYGYDKITPKLPSTGQPGARRGDHLAELRVRERLAGSGWTEVLSYPFASQKKLKKFGFSEGDPRLDPIRLVNPLSGDEEVLRTTLLSGLCDVLIKNVNRGVNDIAIFEIGHVFLRPTDDTPAFDGGPKGVSLPAEPQMLGLAACGNMRLDRFGEEGRKVDVYDLTGALETICHSLGISFDSLVLNSAEEMPFHKGRCAEVSFSDGTYVGIIGELHPFIIKELGLMKGTVVAELRLDRLVKDGIQDHKALLPSPLPGLKFDVALTVPTSTPYREVEELIRHAVKESVGERLTALHLFDVYQGEQLGEGKQSLAFSLVLDDHETQLSDKEENQAIDAIQRKAEEAGWSMRGR